MITSVHSMFFTSEPDALRAFLRDKLELPVRDVGGGWLIFDFVAADLGVHPVDFPGAPPSGTHDISFICDDINATVARFEANGVVFKDAISDQGYGLTIHFEMPGGISVELYESKYGLRGQGEGGPVPMQVTYQPREGKEEALLGLIKSHYPVLRELGLVTGTPPQIYATRSQEGRYAYVELFEWRDEKAPDTAHQLPEVMAVWEPMADLVESMEIARRELV